MIGDDRENEEIALKAPAFLVIWPGEYEMSRPLGIFLTFPEARDWLENLDPKDERRYESTHAIIQAFDGATELGTWRRVYETPLWEYNRYW